MFGVALPVTAPFTCAGEAPGFPSRYSAATPATCGDAIDVPLMVLVAVLPVDQADVTLAPGANTSRQVPKFEKLAFTSEEVVAPTVKASGARAGDCEHAS